MGERGGGRRGTFCSTEILREWMKRRLGYEEGEG